MRITGTGRAVFKYRSYLAKTVAGLAKAWRLCGNHLPSNAFRKLHCAKQQGYSFLANFLGSTGDWMHRMRDIDLA